LFSASFKAYSKLMVFIFLLSIGFSSDSFFNYFFCSLKSIA